MFPTEREISIVSNSTNVEVNDGRICRESVSGWFHAVLNSARRRERDGRVISRAQNILLTIDRNSFVENRVGVLRLAEATIKRFSKKSEYSESVRNLQQIYDNKITEMWGEKTKVEGKTLGFGEVVPLTAKEAFIQKIVDVGLRVLAYTAVTFVVAALAGACFVGQIWIPVLAGAVSVSTLAVVEALIKNLRGKRFTREESLNLHPEMIRHNTQEGPQVGVETKNDLRVVNDTTQSYLWKIELIRSAQSSIDISFNFAGGDRFSELLEEVALRMDKKEGLRVHMMMSPDCMTQEQVDRLDALKKLYPGRFYFLITDRLFVCAPGPRTEENHAKVTVVDDRYFVIGGSGVVDSMVREINPHPENRGDTVAEKMMDSTFRDSDIIGYGDTARTIRGQFYNLYQVWGRRMNKDLEKGEGVYHPAAQITESCKTFHEDENLLKNVSVRFFVGGPEHRKENPISKAIATMVSKAGRNVKVANLLFNPATEIREAVAAATRRGVVTYGQFNGMANFSLGRYYLVSNNICDYPLFQHVHEYNVPDTNFHKKLTTVDNRYAVIGSFNLGQKSAYCDHETALYIDSKEVVEQLNTGIEEDRKRSLAVKNTGPKTTYSWRSRLLSKVIRTAGIIYA